MDQENGDSILAILLEEGTRDPHGDFLALNGTDGTSTNAGDAIMAEAVDFTIAGVTATIIVEEGTGVYKQAQTAIAIAQVTGASSGDVVITNTSSNPNRYVISVFEMTLGSATPTDTFVDASSAQPTGTLDIVEGGFALAVAAALTSSTFTWSGLTERFDATTGGTTNAQGHAWDTEMSAETGRTITATPSGSPSQRVGVAASFGPA